MSEPVRVGIIGTSQFAELMHLRALKTHPGAKVAAVCGRNQERVQEVAAKYGISRTFTDYREMIEKGNLQAVVIVTPDDLHYPMTMDALDAGMHVLCEKPLASTAPQAKEMYTRAESIGVVHMTNFTYRWFPLHRHLQALINEGYAGQPLHCSFRYLAGYGRNLSYRWRFDGKRANGVLGDLGSHMIDLARWFVGDIARVGAHLSSFVQRPGPDGRPCDPANDCAALLLEFASGTQGIIQLSAVANTGERGQWQYVLLHGLSGTLELDNLLFQAESLRGVCEGQSAFAELTVPDELWGGADPGKPLMERLAYVFGTQSVGDRLFIDAILTDKPATPSFREGWKAQEVIDAAIRSHEDGRWLAV